MTLTKRNPMERDFDSLYREYYPGVSATVKRFKFSSDVADDIIQDTFIQAWKSFDSLLEVKAFGGWITTIARNKCLNEIRRRKQTVSESTTDTTQDDENQDEVILIADDSLASFHFEHSISLLTELIEAHKGEPRATIAKYFYIDHRSVKEISVMMDMKPNTVLSHLRRFRLIVSKAMVRLVEEKGIEIN